MWGNIILSLKATANLFLPPVCLHCGNHLEHTSKPAFCSACISSMTPLPPGHCRCCAHPFISTTSRHLCSNCLQCPPHFTRVYACYLYQGVIKDIIHGLKYRNRVITANALGLMLAETLSDEIEDYKPDFIIPVPLHITKLRQRNYNQALEISRSLSLKREVPINTALLVRQRQTEQQQGLSAEQRKKNLRNAFSVIAPVTGKRLLIVDDVMTTGETVRASAKALIKAGANEVRVIVIGRA